MTAQPFRTLLTLSRSKYILLCYLVSRLLFFVPFIASIGSNQELLIKRLASWDAAHYLDIALYGYRGSDIAFFPFFPALTALLTRLTHLPMLLVAYGLANLAFLASLQVLMKLTERFFDARSAYAAVLLTCFHPMSIFFSIPYTESFYLLFSGLGLLMLTSSRDSPVAGTLKYSLAASVFSALTIVTRPTGIAMLPSLITYHLRRRLYLAGVMSALIALAGLAIVLMLSVKATGNALGFAAAQRSWNITPGMNLSGLPAWTKLFSQVFLGPLNTKSSAWVDPYYPLAFLLAIVLIVVAFLLRHQSRWASFILGIVAFLLCWILGGMPLTNLLMIGGGLALAAWGYRYVPLEIGLFVMTSLALYFLKQTTMSLERHFFSTVPLLMFYGAFFSRFPRWMGFLVLWGTVLLVSYAIRLSHGLWIG